MFLSVNGLWWLIEISFHIHKFTSGSPIRSAYTPSTRAHVTFNVVFFLPLFLFEFVRFRLRFDSVRGIVLLSPNLHVCRGLDTFLHRDILSFEPYEQITLLFNTTSLFLFSFFSCRYIFIFFSHCEFHLRSKNKNRISNLFCVCFFFVIFLFISRMCVNLSSANIHIQTQICFEQCKPKPRKINNTT